MNLPGFLAEDTLYRSREHYQGGRQMSHLSENLIVPAIPNCQNCDTILERCENNGWRPRAVCNACATGNCFSGVEDPTPTDPFTPDTWLGEDFPGL